MLAFPRVADIPASTPEGNRIHQFISVMRECGCSFDSQVIPTFGASGQFEYWEGEFTFRPARLRIMTRLTLDHDTAALRTNVRIGRSLVRKHREALHQLITANHVVYQFESDPDSPDDLLVQLTAQLYDVAPQAPRLRLTLGQLASARRELEHARETTFRNYRPLIP
jgi:hypothetical protein